MAGHYCHQPPYSRRTFKAAIRHEQLRVNGFVERLEQSASILDQGREKQAALIALAVYSKRQHVILADDDVDPFDSDNVLWAMPTRFQADVDQINLTGIRGHVLDRSQTPEYSAAIQGIGISCKTIFDATVPFRLREHFVRAQFQNVDVTPFLNNEISKS